MSYLVGFVIVSMVFSAVVVGGVGYYLHRKGLDKAALDAAKQDVQSAVDKIK